ncbi:hypothetical protein HPP92_022961 [Vanilla planifolia]|uniref:Pentatricopeptide repeat-containing protein n=1 Tax=Vanilla planifolia TaxID=51239 RepID=A0A835PQL6_VANPL|nr:hypothetical protein HPP92_022961 [Vanilla planifolia]
MEHYACGVDLYGRAGKLDEAKDLIESMPFKPEVMGCDAEEGDEDKAVTKVPGWSWIEVVTTIVAIDLKTKKVVADVSTSKSMVPLSICRYAVYACNSVFYVLYDLHFVPDVDMDGVALQTSSMCYELIGPIDLILWNIRPIPCFH